MKVHFALLALSCLASTAASASYVKRIKVKSDKQQKVRLYEYERMGRTIFSDGKCMTKTERFEVFQDESYSVALLENECLSLNPAEEPYPVERALADSEKFDSSLIFDEASASADIKEAYARYEKQIEKFFVVNRRASRLDQYLQDITLKTKKRTRIKQRLLKILGTSAYNAKYNEQITEQVEGRIEKRRKKLALLRDKISPFMIPAFKDCGAIAHGTV